MFYKILSLFDKVNIAEISYIVNTLTTLLSIFGFVPDELASAVGIICDVFNG